MIYFRGCTAREKQKSISKATEDLLNQCEVDYNVLDNEKCCGSVLLRTGFIDEAQEQIRKNTEILKDELVVTSCAGCYKTFKEDYEGVNVIHISQLLDSLIDDNKLKLSKSNLNVTYHDSCHLARQCGIINPPRNVIKKAANLVEMESNSKNALCCGAGGGVKSAYPEIAKKMADERITQAKKTKASTLITTCPFCKLNLENSEIEVVDLTEFLVNYGGLDEGK